MHKIWLFFMLVLVLGGTLTVPVMAEESHEYCINDTHRLWEKNIYFNSTLYTFNETANCSYGCLNGQCLPAPTESHDLSLILGVMLVAFFFVYTGLKLDKEQHGAIQILFLFVGMLFVIITFSILTELADYSSITPLETAIDNGYLLTIFVFWIVMFYFIVVFFYKVLVMIGKLQPIKWGL